MTPSSQFRKLISEKNTRRAAAVVHLNQRIRTLETQAMGQAKTSQEKKVLRHKIDFLSKVRDTTIHNIDKSEELVSPPIVVGRKMVSKDNRSASTQHTSRPFFKEGEVEADIMDMSFLG